MGQATIHIQTTEEQKRSVKLQAARYGTNVSEYTRLLYEYVEKHQPVLVVQPGAGKRLVSKEHFSQQEVQ